jgi:flagellar basal-body rod modification protein FlgD
MPISQAAPLTDAAAAALAKAKAAEAARAAAITNKAEPGEGMGKDTFLKLLVAQLKYQNPMEPVDSSQFMAQTAQFSMVERLESMEKATTELLASERSRAATGLLGNQITWKDNGVEKTGVVTGVRMGADGSTLVVGDKDVPYASVTKVTTAPAPTAPASSTTTPPPAAEAPAPTAPAAEAPTTEAPTDAVTPPVDQTSEPAPAA